MTIDQANLIFFLRDTVGYFKAIRQFKQLYPAEARWSPQTLYFHAERTQCEHQLKIQTGNTNAD